MANDELVDFLNSLQRDDCYRVDSILKKTAHEVTQKVYFVGSNGAEQGPYVRKYIENDRGVGQAYEKIFSAQRNGRRFRHLPLIFDCYSSGSTLVVIMEFVPGETLQDVVYRCDPSLELACDIFPLLCDAVNELHQGFDTPIIHRDLKPSNVMITQSNATIIDFGIARTFKEDIDEDTNHFGTKAYAPPEQFGGYRQTDVRSDVFALGAILYFCLTEKTFSRNELDRMIGNKVPSEIGSVIKKATEFSPENRFESVSDLKKAFLIGSELFRHASSRPMRQRQANPQQGKRFGAASSVPDQQSESGHKPFEPYFSGHTGSQVSKTLGIIWDIILLLFYILMVFISISLSVNPDAGSANASLPFGVRLVQYIAVCVLFFGPLLYLISDRRPLKRFFSVFRKMNIKKDLVVFCVSFVLLVIVFILSDLFA